MKKILVAVAGVWLAGCGGGDALKTVDATAEFKPLIEKLNAAWESMDTGKVAPFFAKDADFAFYDIAPLKYKGWQEYEEGFKKVAADWKRIKLSVRPDLRVSKSGNIAWASYTVGFEIEPKKGDMMKGEGRSTEILEKRGNAWLIVHEHVSVPMAEPKPAPKPAAKAAKKRRRR